MPPGRLQDAWFASTGPAGRGETFPVHPHCATTSRGMTDPTRDTNAMVRTAPTLTRSPASPVPANTAAASWLPGNDSETEVLELPLRQLDSR